MAAVLFVSQCAEKKHLPRLETVSVKLTRFLSWRPETLPESNGLNQPLRTVFIDVMALSSTLKSSLSPSSSSSRRSAHFYRTMRCLSTFERWLITDALRQLKEWLSFNFSRMTALEAFDRPASFALTQISSIVKKGRFSETTAAICASRSYSSAFNCFFEASFSVSQFGLSAHALASLLMMETEMPVSCLMAIELRWQWIFCSTRYCCCSIVSFFRFLKDAIIKVFFASSWSAFVEAAAALNCKLSSMLGEKTFSEETSLATNFGSSSSSCKSSSYSFSFSLTARTRLMRP